MSYSLCLFSIYMHAQRIIIKMCARMIYELNVGKKRDKLWKIRVTNKGLKRDICGKTWEVENS